MDVKNFVNYLGVRLGNVRHQHDDQGWGLTIEQAFAPALQEAFRRARVVSRLQLSMDERAFMLTSWILPVVALVSKAYYAPISVIRQLKLVYHVTMGTNSWGITLPILSRPRTQGGLARGTCTAGARAVSHAPGSGSVRQPFGGASQVSRQGSGDLLCMGDNHRVHTIQR